MNRISTCNHTSIFVPEGTKFKLTGDISSFTVDCEEGLIDSSAEKEIQIKQAATGVVHIRAEKVEY